jgi:hypothetical protein
VSDCTHTFEERRKFGKRESGVSRRILGAWNEHMGQEIIKGFIWTSGRTRNMKNKK